MASPVSSRRAQRQCSFPPVSWPRRRGGDQEDKSLDACTGDMIATDKFERGNMTANTPEQDQTNTSSQQTLGARRKGTVDHISVQLPPTKINMDYLIPDVEYNSEHSCWVKAWLDEHPEFFEAYLIRKGSRSMIDSWLVTHALSPGITATTLHNVDEEELDESESNIIGGKSSVPLGENDGVVGSGNTTNTANNESLLVTVTR